MPTLQFRICALLMVTHGEEGESELFSTVHEGTVARDSDLLVREGVKWRLDDKPNRLQAKTVRTLPYSTLSRYRRPGQVPRASAI